MQRSGPFGSSRTSSYAKSTSGCACTRAVSPPLNFTRSTASASPAGTRALSASQRTGERSRRSSSWRSPMALCGLSDRSEFEHTSSASPSSLWAGERLPGFCSCSTTRTPASARRSAASVPARPPPTMCTSVCMRGVFFHAARRAASRSDRSVVADRHSVLMFTLFRSRAGCSRQGFVPAVTVGWLGGSWASMPAGLRGVVFARAFRPSRPRASGLGLQARSQTPKTADLPRRLARPLRRRARALRGGTRTPCRGRR